MKENSINEELITSSENNNIMEQEVELNPISPESFKKYEILDLKNISFFDVKENSKIEQLNNISHYLKREKIDEILKNESFNLFYLEKLLEQEDTYDYLQKLYLEELIKKLNSIKGDEIEKNKIIEKIQKSSIILPKNIYESKVKNLKLDYKEELNYNDFKKNLIETLTFLLDPEENKLDESSLIISKNKLNIKKKFNFCREPEFGDNNYYFYKLSLTFYSSMNNVFKNLMNYDYGFIIQKILDLLAKYSNEELKQKKYIFQYLTNILLDPDFIKNDVQYCEIKNFIESEDVDAFELEKKIDEIKKSQFNFPKNAIKYNINYNKKKNQIEYLIVDGTKIGKKYLNKIYRKEFDLKKLNKNILKILNCDLLNFEYNILRSIKFREEYFSEYYKQFRPTFDRIVTNILKSNAARKFFIDNYQTKYKNLTYHFNDSKLINKVLDKISFAPIFNETISGYTDPVDLSITINSIPSKYGDKNINIYHRKILQLGRIILIALHEIMGHYFRRYYSYFTRGSISFDTKDDNIIFTGDESGFYIEEEFLGFSGSHKSTLSISDSLCLLNYKKFNEYPVKKKKEKFNINEDSLRDIIKNNNEVFDFIGNQADQVTFKDYLTFLVPVDAYGIKRNTFLNEDFIYLKESFLLG